MKQTKTEKVFVRLTIDQVQYLDEYAKALGIDRSKMLRLLINESMPNDTESLLRLSDSCGRCQNAKNTD